LENSNFTRISPENYNASRNLAENLNSQQNPDISNIFGSAGLFF